MNSTTRLRALDPRRLPKAGVLVTDGEADVLVAACAAQGASVTPSCSLCEAGCCCVHRGPT